METTTAIIQDGVAYLDGTEPTRVRVRVWTCPHCAGRYRSLNIHYAKSACGRAQKNREEMEARERERRAQETCPECGEQETLKDRSFNPLWTLSPRCCDGCYAGEKPRACATCRETFVPNDDDTFVLCAACYQDKQEADYAAEQIPAEERCEVCETKTGDLHEGHNGEFTGKWCCAACIAKDDELGDEEEPEEEPYVPTRSELIWAWLSANSTEWEGKTARDIAWALSEDKHDVNRVLYADARFIQMTVAGQSAPAWRCA